MLYFIKDEQFNFSQNFLNAGDDMNSDKMQKYHDRMTETYSEITETSMYNDKTNDINFLNNKYGLSFDNNDMIYYNQIFKGLQ